MLKTKTIAAALALSLAATGAALAAHAGRAGTLRHCNKHVEKFKNYTWGDEQTDRYRACMAEHGQPE